MTDRVKKVSAGVLLTMGTSINFASVVALAYAQGKVDARTDEKIEQLESKSAYNSAAIMKTRESLDDKVDRLLQAVARLEGRLDKRP